MGRREKGEGSIYFDKRNNCYAASFWTEAGKRKYLYASIKGEVTAGRKEAKLKLEVAMKQNREGTLVVSSATTLAVYLRDWLETISLRIRASSYPTWKSHIEIHIIPAIGGYKLQLLRPEHIQKKLIVVLIKKGLASSTIGEIYKVLKHALSDGVKQQKLSISPCRGIVLPKDEDEDGEDIQVWSSAQVVIAFDYLAKKKHPREAMFVAFLTTGMRSGEGRSLQWRDVDLEGKTEEGPHIAVNRTVVFVPVEGYIINRPKTKSGRRKIPLTDYALAKLSLYKKEQMLKHEGAWSEELLVFPGKGGYYSKSALQNALDRLIANTGLPVIRVHDMRHTAITEWLIAGVDLEAARKFAGHSRVEQTLKYVHFLGDTLKQNIQRYSAYLSEKLA